MLKVSKILTSSETYSMPLEEAIDEHKRLVHVLETPDHKDDLQEAKDQGSELSEMLKKESNQ